MKLYMEHFESIDELREAGMKILVDGLGDANAMRFVRHCGGKPGWDFGEWLNEQPEESDDEIIAEIERGQAEDRAAGIPDCRAI